MNFIENPFYILNVSPQTNRRGINAAADEMGFVLDSELCTNAQNILLTPKKRLEAELDWFLDLNEEDVQRLKEIIRNNGLINTEDLPVISQFNAMLYNFSSKNNNTVFSLLSELNKLSEAYDALDFSVVQNEVNLARMTAGFTEATETEVLSGMAKKLDEVKKMIGNRLETLSEEDYISLISALAESMVEYDDSTDGTIIKELIGQYEIREQAKLESYVEKINKQIDHIKNLANYDNIEINLRSLIIHVKNWDKIAQPIQLASVASGMPHEMSEDLGNRLRQLAIFLHNEKNKTEAALMLTTEMKPIFAELAALADTLDEDSDLLDNMIASEKATTIIAEKFKEFEDFANEVKWNYSSEKIQKFISKCKSIDDTIKSLKITTYNKEDLRMRLCMVARNVAIDLHNDSHQTKEAYNIINELVGFFGDIDQIKNRLIEDKTALNNEILAEVEREKKQCEARIKHQQEEEKKKKRIKIGLLIASIIVIVVLIQTRKSGSTVSGSNAISTTAAPVVAPATNNSSGYGSPKIDGTTSTNKQNVQTKPVNTTKKEELRRKAEELEEQINQLESRLTKLQKEVEGYETDLENLSYDLDYYEEQYNLTGRDSYRVEYNNLVDEYQYTYEQYSSTIDEYNRLYNKYDSTIEEHNQIVAEYNALL